MQMNVGYWDSPSSGRKIMGASGGNFIERNASGNYGMGGNTTDTGITASTSGYDLITRTTDYVSGMKTMTINGQTFTETNQSSLAWDRHYFLFTMGDATDTIDYKGWNTSCRMTFAKFYEDDTLVRSFIPFKNSSGEIGFYDTVGKTFYTSESSTSFIAGSNSEASEYTQLEYIESTGTQYIDTGIIPTQNLRLYVEFMSSAVSKSSSSQKGGSILGVFDGTNDVSEQINFGSSVGQRDFFLWHGNTYSGGQTINSLSRIEANTKYTVYLDENYYWYCNDSLVSSNKQSPMKNTTNLTIFLFGANSSSNGKVPFDYGNLKIYTFKMYSGSSLVHNFVPVKDANGTVGMYDTITKTFHGNAGTGTFVAGPEI